MRYFNIDFLRAVSILGMIAIHVYAYVQIVPLHGYIWNWLHFVVVGFVFCSGFVLYAKYKEIRRRQLFSWWKKRITRLLVPFYVYLGVHTLLVILFPQLFHGFDLQVETLFLLESVTLIGGLSISWLPLLFVQMMLLFPILTYLKSKKHLFIGYIFAAVGVSGYFTFFSFPYEYYRVVMWIPWSLVLVLSFLYYDFQKRYKSQLLPLFFALFFGTLFLILLVPWESMGKSYKLTGNKYPPGFYYLFYASMCSFFVLWVGEARVWVGKLIGRFVSFVSKQSYPLFFVHYIVLDVVLTGKIDDFLPYPFLLFLIVTLFSLCITYILSNYTRVYGYVRERRS